MSESPEPLLAFWFGDDLDAPERVDARVRVWFGGGRDFDARVRARFERLPERAARGELDAWREGARPALALVLALDQLPRNLHRGGARAFAFDPLAREAAEQALGRGFDAELHPVEASFLYLPLEHAEDPEAQERSVALFRALQERAPAALRPQIETFLGFAERHREVIRRFGRFPHRNLLLGRPSTAEELAYLRAGGETFGASGGA